MDETLPKILYAVPKDEKMQYERNQKIIRKRLNLVLLYVMEG